MRDPKRIPKVLELIEQAWQICPDLRFFQLMYNLQFQIGNKSGDLHYMEDEQIIEQLTEALGSGTI